MPHNMTNFYLEIWGKLIFLHTKDGSHYFFHNKSTVTNGDHIITVHKDDVYIQHDHKFGGFCNLPEMTPYIEKCFIASYQFNSSSQLKETFKH